MTMEEFYTKCIFCGHGLDALDRVYLYQGEPLGCEYCIHMQRAGELPKQS